jgi:energy-coupling factor transport system permease protein
VVYHTLTWLAWLAGAAYLALANQQPLQSIVLILATGMVFDLASRLSPRRQSWGTFLRFGLWVWLMALAFNLLSVHAGEMVVFTLPRHWPIIGGPITLEALLYGLANGASLFAVLLVFATFNLAVETHRLLRWVPAGLYQAGLIASIAVAFVPQMFSSLNQIREAQRVRGLNPRGLRGLVPLFVPLITTALERSLTLAESMEARGFGGITRESSDVRRYLLRTMTLAGLLALLIGLILRVTNPQIQWPSLAWLALGVLLTVGALYVQGRQVMRTHYQRERWQQRDTLVCLACAASMLMMTATHARNPQILSYYPYPPSTPWPGFAIQVGLAAALLAAPAFLWPAEARGSQQADTDRTNPGHEG